MTGSWSAITSLVLTSRAGPGIARLTQRHLVAQAILFTRHSVTVSAGHAVQTGGLLALAAQQQFVAASKRAQLRNFDVSVLSTLGSWGGPCSKGRGGWGSGCGCEPGEPVRNLKHIMSSQTGLRLHPEVMSVGLLTFARLSMSFCRRREIEQSRQSYRKQHRYVKAWVVSFQICTVGRHHFQVPNPWQNCWKSRGLTTR
jgi:hypothetical protein